MLRTVEPFELPIHYIFSSEDWNQLYEALETISSHPYHEYEEFMQEISDLASTPRIPTSFVSFCKTQIGIDRRYEPYVVMRNCPIDKDLPIFCFDDPVASKHELKKTFIAEGFLALYSSIMGMPPIGYINVNGGDVFQDIYPKESMKETQSQKAIGPLYFHKDLANHFVRPDYVNMLSMRSNPVNRVYTTFVRNVDVLEKLSLDTLEQLRKREYDTPFDDLTVIGGTVELGEAQAHPVLTDDMDLRYFENRTVGLTESATDAVAKLNAALHAVKCRVHMMPGDFISVHNNFSVHAKDIVEVVDADQLRTRWTIKTVNVDSLEAHADHYLPGRYGIVNG